ncbi:MAG: DUF799 family lipoprotein [Planctomycetes bacterium]|nr:DUF799 family lipoprotein [Planctomycetota bacterium]
MNDRRFGGSAARAAALVLLLAAGGCGSVSNSVYTHEQFDLGSITKVAVLPFQNFSTESRAGERILSIFCSELLSMRLFDVVDPAQTADYLKVAKVDSATLSSPELKKFKQALGVNAVVFGSVDEYSMQAATGDSFPVVTVSARMVDVETGTVLWMCSASASGDPKVPILSLGRVKTLPEMAQTVCRHLVETLQ